MDYVANFDLENNEINTEFNFEQPVQFDAILELNPAGIPDINGSELINVEKYGSTFTIKSANYTHEQGIASKEWVINHNLEKEPSVVVVDTADEEQIPDRKVYNSKNQVTLYFLSEFAGKAYLN